VAGNDHQRNPRRPHLDVAERETVGDGVRQDVARYAEKLEQGRRPVAGVQVPQQRARGIAGIDDETPAPGETVHEEAGQRHDGEGAPPPRLLDARIVIEAPAHLAGAVVRGNLQTGEAPYEVRI